MTFLEVAKQLAAKGVDFSYLGSWPIENIGFQARWKPADMKPSANDSEIEPSKA